jgi:hypothetical protein
MVNYGDLVVLKEKAGRPEDLIALSVCGKHAKPDLPSAAKLRQS